MFNVIEIKKYKETGERLSVEKVYAVDHANGHTLFLIYDFNLDCWKWQSASNYFPVD